MGRPKGSLPLTKTGLLMFLNPRAPAYVPLNQAQSQPDAGVAMLSKSAAEHSGTDQTAAAADLLLAELMGSTVSADDVICTGEATVRCNTELPVHTWLP